MTELKLLVREFLADKATYCSTRTLVDYQVNLQRFLELCPVVFLEKLQTKDIKEYILVLRKKGIRNVTVNSYLRVVKVFCTWLYEEDYTDYNLFRGVRLPRSDAALKRPLTEDEAAAIERVLCPRDNIIFYLMLGAGLRAGEVTKLLYTDVDFEHGVIFLRNCKFNKNRIVPIPEKVREYSGLYHSDGVFFVASRFHDQMSVNSVKQIFQKAKKRSGVSRVHAHLLRHTFATSYIIGGGSLEKLRLLLGHSDYSVTKNYLHLGNQYELLKYPIYRLDADLFKTGYEEE